MVLPFMLLPFMLLRFMLSQLMLLTDRKHLLCSGSRCAVTILTEIPDLS